MYGEDKDGDGVRDEPDQSSAFGQGDAEFNIFNTDRQLAALQTAVTMLRPFPEQKALIYFGSGLRLNGTDNTAQLRATTNAAVRANVTINPVDARGLVALSPLGDATQRSPGGQAMFTGQLAMNAMNGFQRSQDTLFALAKDTGGTATFDNNDLSAGIVSAAQAMSSYYIIGFYSTHPANDGKFRRIKVSLANGKEGELAYRQGYFADKEWARQNGVERERQLEEALMLDNPITDITIAMELNFFQLNRAEYFVPVHVKIPGSELALARKRGAQRTLLDFIGEVKDNYGITIQNVRDKLDIPISDKTATELSARPIQYETGLHAAARPVRHQVPGARRRGRAPGHLSDVVYDSQPQSRRGATADQLRGAQQPASAVRRGAPHGEEFAEHAGAGEQPAGVPGRKAGAERHARLQHHEGPLRAAPGLRARRHRDGASRGLRHLLQGRREGVRNPTHSGDRRPRRALEGGAIALQYSASGNCPRALRVPGHRARARRTEGGFLARARRADSLSVG